MKTPLDIMVSQEPSHNHKLYCSELNIFQYGLDINENRYIIQFYSGETGYTNDILVSKEFLEELQNKLNEQLL